MKPNVKYSSARIRPAKTNTSADKTPEKLPRLRTSQRKAEEVCQIYFMKLRSGLIIEKACYFRKETTKKTSPKTGDKHKKQHLIFSACRQLPMKQHRRRRQSSMVTTQALSIRSNEPKIQSMQAEISFVSEDHASLSTFNDRFITFAFEDGTYAIYVEDLRKDQEKGDEVDGRKLMVNLSPSEDKNFCLQANSQNLSLEIREWPETTEHLPDQAFFLLHHPSSDCVSFECKSNPGMFIGVCDNHLKLIPEEKHSYKTMFKLCKM